MITSRIIGADGKQLKVNGEGEIAVTVHSHPPDDEKYIGVPYYAYFTTDADSNDMVVTTETEFSIRALTDTDLWIHSLNVLIADAGASFNEFGNLPALSNGVEFKWESQKLGTRILHEGIKDNLEWFRYGNIQPTIVDLSGGGADSIVVPINLQEVFGLPYGVILRKGTLDKLSFTVKDNLTGITTFNIQARGITKEE
jgi:hypothetical protein